MFKRAFISIIIVPILYSVSAQEAADTTRYWKIDGNTSLNFSQVSLTNWSEGGDGSVAGTFLLKVNANKKKGKHTWDNALDFEYGLTKNDGESLRKSVDKLTLASKYGYNIGKDWFFATLGDLKTQVAKGYNYPNKDLYISNLMAPGYLNIALGFDYKPRENLSLFLSPLDVKSTFVLDDSLSTEGSFGVDPGDKYRAELGAYLKFTFSQKNLVKNVDFETTLDLFSNYLENTEKIDVNWDFKFNMTINKFMSANIGGTLKYDDDIKYVDGDGNKHGPRVQFKQFLGVGIAYKF